MEGLYWLFNNPRKGLLNNLEIRLGRCRLRVEAEFTHDVGDAGTLPFTQALER